MKVDVEKLKAIGVKHGLQIAEEIAVELVFPALEEAVKASATPIDDAVLALLEEPLKKALTDLLAKAKA